MAERRTWWETIKGESGERTLHAEDAVDEDVGSDVHPQADACFHGQDLVGAALEGRAAQAHRGFVVENQ